MGRSQPCGGKQRPGSNPQLAVGFWLSGLAAGAVWRSRWVGLGPVSLSPCPGFPSAFSRLLVSGVSYPRLGAQGKERRCGVWAPLSLPGVSSGLALALAVVSLSFQLSWWLQLPGSANTHPLLSPPTHSSSLRADHGFWMLLISKLGFLGGSVVKDIPANAGEIRDIGLTPELGRSPGGGHGNPLQYSRLENPSGQRSLVGYSAWGGKRVGHSFSCLVV